MIYINCRFSTYLCINYIHILSYTSVFVVIYFVFFCFGFILFPLYSPYLLSEDICIDDNIIAVCVCQYVSACVWCVFLCVRTCVYAVCVDEADDPDDVSDAGDVEATAIALKSSDFENGILFCSRMRVSALNASSISSTINFSRSS